MVHEVSREWGELALRGVVAVLLALACFLVPGITLASLVLAFGAFAFVDGVLLLAPAVKYVRNKIPAGGYLLLQALCGIAAGVITWIWPGMTALMLLFFVAFWAIATGFFEIFAAIQLRKEIEHEWLLGLSGAVSVGLGLLLFLMPIPGLLSIVYLIGAYALLSGVMLIALAFKVRAFRHGYGGGSVFAHR